MPCPGAAHLGRGAVHGAQHPINGVGARGFRQAFPACDPDPDDAAAWGEGPALHAHQIVLEVLSETGGFGLLLWLAGVALAWRAWRFADERGPRTRAAGDAGAGRDGVPVQHPSRVLFDVLGRPDVAAGGAVRRQSAGASSPSRELKRSWARKWPRRRSGLLARGSRLLACRFNLLARRSKLLPPSSKLLKSRPKLRSIRSKLLTSRSKLLSTRS